MRHDLNNILQVVLANLELLGPSVGGDAKALGRLHAAQGALERALALIDTMPSTRIPDRIQVPSLRLLVVEDDALIRMITAEMLVEMGHNVTQAASASDALAALDRPIDVVITDLNLPDMSGIEFAAAGRLKQPSLAVVIATGDAASASAALAAQRYVWLLKPFNAARLCEAMRIAVQSS